MERSGMSQIDDVVMCEWVDVNEQLPKDAEPVIVQGGCGHYSHKYKQWFTNMERDNFGEYRAIQWEVTHWMPIPKLNT
jgi:hypothetical protein